MSFGVCGRLLVDVRGFIQDSRSSRASWSPAPVLLVGVGFAVVLAAVVSAPSRSSNRSSMVRFSSAIRGRKRSPVQIWFQTIDGPDAVGLMLARSFKSGRQHSGLGYDGHPRPSAVAGILVPNKESRTKPDIMPSFDNELTGIISGQPIQMPIS